jgi:dTMP kinase
MKIISVEGLDKSGKKTQSELLAEFLRAKRFRVAESQSPNYDTPTGELIRKWLAKEYNVDQKTIEFVFTANMQEQQEQFKQLEEEYQYDFLIMDRYTGSQRAYATATGSDIEFVEMLQKDMRQPDIMIFIDITPEESLKRKGKHNNGVNDRYEEDIELLHDVRSRYLVYNTVPKILINGMQSIEGIHKDIVMILTPILKSFYSDEINRWVKETVNASKEK